MACELIHAATLLHDDVIDEGSERRGRAAARVVYGNSASILGGDHLLIEALRSVASGSQPQLLNSLLDAISQIITAEALQLGWRGRFEPDRNAYRRVIHGKTAVLFGWALAAGGGLAGVSQGERSALKNAGLALGEAFQLIDDVLDLDGDPSRTGKGLFTDLREGKLTWPLILAAERIDGFTQQVRRCMDDDDLDSQVMVVQTLQRCGALDATRALARERVEFAVQELQVLPAGDGRDALELIAEAVVDREA
jgi:octaprenyl-diphosphate synthase